MGLKEFFERRKEEAIRRKILTMMDLVEECNSALTELLSRALDSDDYKKLVETVHMKEHGADILRRSILDEIERSAFSTGKKAILMSIVKALDVIADWHLTVARVIDSIERAGAKLSLPDELKELIFKAMDANKKAIAGVRRAVESVFERDVDAALGAADEVERLEELVDRYFADMTAILYSGRVKGVSELAVFSMIEAIENIADACENACDEIRIAAVTLAMEKK